MVVKYSTQLVTGLPLTLCRFDLQRQRKLGLAALFTAIVPGAGFMDVKGRALSDQSAVGCSPTAIDQPGPTA